MKKALSADDETSELPELDMDVCLGANYFKTGEDPVIKPQSDYPDWLWELQKDAQPAPDSKHYWRRKRKKEAHKRLATLREKR